ncbi:hypothetical protein [Phocaeicola dorei]|uniref:hypothetical protein n=1 Tax=Phocaeicola dorei TaxID=357276 RepID=UPI00319E1F8A
MNLFSYTAIGYDCGSPHFYPASTIPVLSWSGIVPAACTVHPFLTILFLPLYPAWAIPFLPIPITAFWLHSCHRRLVFQTQSLTAALGSVALKCISRKILPFCERVIFQKKRRKQLIRQSCKASVNPKRFRQKKNRTEGK